MLLSSNKNKGKIYTAKKELFADFRENFWEIPDYTIGSSLKILLDKGLVEETSITSKGEKALNLAENRILNIYNKFNTQVQQEIIDGFKNIDNTL